MNVEEALKNANKIVSEHHGKPLTEVQELIFRGAWEGKTYEEIVNDSGYQYQLNYIKQDAGPKLWKLLSIALNEKINKAGLQAAFLQVVLPHFEKPSLEERFMQSDPICNRDVFILIDQSGSMTTPDAEGGMRRWDSLRELIMSHVDSILRHEVNGAKICSSMRISLFSRNRVKDEKFTVDDVTKVKNIFRENQPDATTFITPTLKDCLNEWFKSRNASKTEGAFFIIYTDGQFDDTVAFEKLIKETCSKLENDSLIKILIIGVGKEIDVEYFERLDTNTKNNLDMHQKRCDIVVFDLVNNIEDIKAFMRKEL